MEEESRNKGVLPADLCDAQDDVTAEGPEPILAVDEFLGGADVESGVGGGIDHSDALGPVLAVPIEQIEPDLMQGAVVEVEIDAEGVGVPASGDTAGSRGGWFGRAPV